MTDGMWTETRPDKHTSRAAWEESWDNDLVRVFKAYSRFDSLSALTVPGLALFNSDGMLLQLDREQKLICEMQKDLANAASLRFSEDDFEQKWKTASEERRRDVVLEGIYRTMCIADMEERRKWCPDSTLRHLTSDGGQTYLHMLKSLLPSSLNSPIVEPATVPHPLVDRLLTIPPADKAQAGYKTFYRSCASSRVYCLTTIIWNIFLVFHGQSEQQVPIKNSRPTTERVAQLGAALNNPGLVQRAVKDCDIIRKDLSYSCWTCERTPALHSIKLQACGRCRGIGRKVWYCSKECQVQDWKNGMPRPHKTVCGKPLSEENDSAASPGTTESAATESSNVQSQGAFKPPPALLHQMSLLNDNDALDYVVVFPYPKPDMGICLSTFEGKTLFRLLRKRAFQTGDPTAVHRMYDMLKTFAEENKVPRSILRKQLLSEYGVDVEEKPTDPERRPAPFNTQELRAAIEAIGALST